jgi:hypothetical protein
LNFGHCDFPFDLAQGGGGELVEPFGFCDLLFEFYYMGMHLTPVTTRCSVSVYGGKLPTYIDGT